MIFRVGLIFENFQFYTKNSAYYGSYASIESLQENFFYLDTKVEFHSREVYHVLDFIGDLGGLFEGMEYICGFLLNILSFFGFKPLQAYLVNRIFY